MECQPIFHEPFRQHLVNASRVVLPLEEHDEIVRITYEQRAAFQPWTHVAYEPLVEPLSWTSEAARLSAHDRECATLPRTKSIYGEVSIKCDRAMYSEAEHDREAGSIND